MLEDLISVLSTNTRGSGRLLTPAIGDMKFSSEVYGHQHSHLHIQINRLTPPHIITNKKRLASRKGRRE